MSKKITDIIFDLDGTLIDSSESILKCLKKTLASNSIKPICSLDPELIGPPLANTISKLTGIYENKAVSQLAEDFKRYYDLEGYKSTLPFSGVTELLVDCEKAGLSLHICTNKRIKPTTLILDHLNWTKYFKTIYTIDLQSALFKNKAAMLRAQLKVEKISSKNVIYVGDRYEDYESASINQLKFFGAIWGHQDKKLIENTEILCIDKVENFSLYTNISI